MSFAAPRFTNAGKQLQASALAGETIEFTQIKMGDGALGSGAIAELSDLISTQAAVGLTSIQLSDNSATVKGTFSNIGLSSGFYWREVGLFAADPANPDDRSKDILYCYQNAGDLAEYIPSASSSQVEKVIAISAVVGDVENITAIVASQAYTTPEEATALATEAAAEAIGAHDADTTAHQDIRAALGNTATPTDISNAVAAHNVSTEAHGDIREEISKKATPSNIETAVSNHNTDLESHADIRGEISKKATPADVTNAVSDHDSNENAHADMRQAIAIRPTNEEVADEITEHNESETAHADIRTKLAGKAEIPTYTTSILLADGWDAGQYSLESQYPSDQYDIEIGPSNDATTEQIQAYGAALIPINPGANIVIAKGEVPTVDIPLVIKAVRK